MSASEARAATSPTFLDLPSPLPAEAPGEPEELRALRSGPIGDADFIPLRRRLREAEDWRSLAALLVLYAASIDQRPKIAELCGQAAELLLDRVKDRPAAAHALARLLQAQPDNERAIAQLEVLYAELDWPRERAVLMRLRIHDLERRDPSAVPAALTALAQLLEESFMAIREAILLYQRALARDPGARAASEALIRLYLNAGAWSRASELMQAELTRLDPAADRERFTALHLQLARIQAEEHDNVAAAALHLQTALKANPDDLRALRAFGVLYLGSGKASDEGLGKAADIFFRAAKLAHKQGDGRELLKLLRRTLSLRPDHYEAGTMLAEQLSAGERWTDLDDLYNRWLGFVDPDDAYDLWIQRGELLETHLARREEARVCYEAASRFEGPDGPAWRRLEELYGSLGDYEALVGLLEAHAEQQPDAIPTARLLRAAEIYRDELHNDERASYFFFKVLEREPFNRVAFEGYKEHWRRKNSWSHLRDLLLYQVDQAANVRGPSSPLHDPAFAEEFVELAEISERRLGDLDGALDAWQRMQAAYPNDYRPREPIARLEKRIRILDQLIQSQENELRRAHDPEQRLAVLRRLTQAYRERTIDPARAIDLLSELLTVAPDDANAEAALADLYRRVGDYSGLITILRQQYEAARRPAQQMALVRQMAEIWQDELQDNESAIWACDQLVGYRADDPEIHRRLAALYIATGRYDKLYQTLERELSVTTDARAKIPLLRRMASIAEARLADQRKAARVYADLLALDPHNLDVVDKIAAIYEHSELYQELAALLGKAAASGRTPPIRQLDYLMRLGHIAEDHLSDPDLACSAFEKVLRIHRDHRGAVEALTRIYRAIASWHGLGAMLGNLQELVDTDEEILQLGLERAEVLADHLDNAAAAARVLEQLQQAIAPGNRQINRRLLQLYTRAADHRRLVRHAEILLLAADDRAERRLLLERIAKTWVEHLGDPRAGLNAFARYTDEAGEDPEGLRILADLQELAGDHQAALRTLDRRLTLLRDPGQQIAVLEHMAELCEVHLQHYKRAMALLGKGLGIAPSHAGLRAKIVAFAGRHDMWKDLLHAYGERFGEMSQRADVKGQIELCMSASLTALEQIHDPGLAFGWAKKAYFVGVSAGPDARAEARAAHERLKSLAAEHGLWSDYLAVLDQEVQRARERGVLGDHASIEQLRAAAAIAKDQLRDPQRAIAYMRVAHQARPDDQDLARQIEALAEGNQLWSEQIAVHEERLARATSNLARFEAHAAIARILEKHVGDPTAAIARLRTLWEQLVGEEESLAEEALDLLVEIAEAHHRWPELADLRRAIARRHFAQGRRSDGLSALLAAATIEEQRAGDGLAALRTLRGGLGHDPGGALLLPRFRAIASDLDRDRPEGQPPLGALATLIALQDLIGASDDPTARIPLLGQRALLREGELHDPRGAATEWLRVLALAPQHDEARRELDRLAQREHLTELRLLLPSWEIQRLHGQRRPGQPPTPRHLEQEITLLHGLAELYEVALARPEYALRARLSAWRLRPSLPPAEGELPEPHRALWRLAAATGVYVTPPSPRDPLLHPHVTAPEHGDEQLWRRLGIASHTFLPRPEASAEPAEITEHTAVVELSDIVEPAEVTNVANITEITELEPLDAETDLEPLDAELEPDDDLLEADDLIEPDQPAPGRQPPPNPAAKTHPASAPHTAAPPPPPRRPPSAPHRVARPPSAPHVSASRPPPAPPPPPSSALTEGLPDLPALSAPVLPPRPAVASAWEELALAYRECHAAARSERAGQALAFARFYEEGPKTPLKAFEELIEAIILDPDHRPARAALEALAARVGEPRRLIAAYERIHGELTLPEHMVELSLHLAELYSREGEPARAEEHYRGVLAVVPQHIPALRALADLYAAAGQGRELVDVRTRLLDLEAPTLSEDARIAAVLGLSRDLERLHRYADAARRIEALAREQPERRELQERLAELLLRQDDHRAALDVLRGLYERSEGEARRALLIQIAELQQSKLADPEAAIATWERLHAEHPGDPAALTHLQELYLQTHRYQPLLAILDARLAAIPHGKSPARVPLLVAKARALQEGLGDQEGATLILEALAEEDPENDEVTLGLSRLYRRGGRFAEGIAILRDRLDDLDDEDHDIRSRISLALSEILENEAHDRDAAMLVIEEALAGAPDDYDLLQRRAVLARALADYPVVVDTLAQLGDPDGLLEAADLARTRLLDPDWAARLYSQVLSGADKHSADPDGARRLSAAIEGLVHLRLSAGDLSGADALISDQLATIPQAELRARILTELGRTLWRVTHDLSLARARFDAALREDPDYSAARLRLGEVLIEAGALAEAEPLLEEAVESFVLTRDGQHLAPALVLLAQIFEATDRSADAYRRLTSALRQDPDDLGIRAAIARNRHAAGRWRELLQAVEPVEAQLDGGKLFSGDDRRRAGELLLLAAAADAGLGDRSRQFARLERAAALTPEDPRPILQLQELARAAADPARAARYAAMLARTRPDPLERGRELVEAGMLHEAAALAIAEADEPAPDADARIEALRAGAFAALRDGLALLLDHPDAVVERRHLEVTFWVAAGRDPDAALACLDRLLVRDDLRPELRRDLLLEGAHIALQRRAEGDLERAYAYASHAIEGSPDLAAPIARMFDVLEAYGGDEAQETVERLVLGFFNEHGLRSHQGEAEDAARTALLIRLADTQNEHPSRAIRLLERAAALDLSGLGLRERHHLDRLYQAAGAEPAKIRKNLEAILALDPFDVASVSALADLCERAADLDQAHALYELLLAIEPEHPRAAAFLDAHELLLAEQGALDMVAIQEPPPPSAGLIEALSQLWKGAAAFVCERLPRLDVPEAAIIRDSDAAWYSTWGDVRARLSAPPYTLADGDALGERAGADLWIGPKCQYPPVMVLGPGAKQAPESTLRFAVGRALFFARPGNLLAAALAHDTQISLLAAFLQTYHPRHQRRRPLDDASAAIAQNLARKVPLKLAQQLGAVLREHEHERFDSREWRAWVLHGGDRVGLCAAGELGAALDHLGLPLGAEARQGALQARRSEPGLRALLAFAGGRTYAAARHGLGFRVRPRGA
jgi:thioredoxin-like negative regulator of GroEL